MIFSFSAGDQTQSFENAKQAVYHQPKTSPRSFLMNNENQRMLWIVQNLFSGKNTKGKVFFI
jgi:hypothetical protein